MRRFVFVVVLVCGAMGLQAGDLPDTTISETGGDAVSSARIIEIDERSPYLLPDSIVITANRFRMRADKSIWPVSAVTLHSQDHESELESVLDGYSGVDIRSYNGSGSVATLSNWGLFNRHLLLLYNGRVVKDYSLGGFNLSNFSADEFNRIEILKGPQSAFYGSDAVGGIVNLISPTSMIDKTQLTMRAGSFGYRQYHVEASRKIGMFGIGGFGEYGTTDNVRDNSGSERILFNLRSEYLSPDGQHSVALSGRYFTDSLGLPGPVPEEDYIPVYGNDRSSSLTTFQGNENYSLDLQYRFHDINFGQAQLDVFWEKKNLDYNSLYNYFYSYLTVDTSIVPHDTITNIDSVDVHSRTIFNKRSAGVNARIMKETRSINLSGGIDYLSGSVRSGNEEISDGTNVDGPFAPYQYSYESHSYWAAGQDQFDLWSNVSWQMTSLWRTDLSGRMQFIKNRKVQPSFNAGAMLIPMEWIKIRIGHGYAFRTPAIAEQFADEVYTAGSIDLSPETSRSSFLNISGCSIDNKVNAQLTLFYQTVDSLIQYSYDPSVYKYTPKNVDRFKTRGAELLVRYHPIEAVSTRWSGVYQKAQQTSSDGDDFIRAYYVPDFKWRGQITGHHKQINVSFQTVYTGERYLILYDNSEKHIQSVWELGLVVSARVSSHLNLSLTVSDITDQQRPDQFGYTVDDGDYPSLGRRFLLASRVAF